MFRASAYNPGVATRSFTKYEGLGNDFIVVDGRSSGPVDPSWAVAWCDRRSGVGADGVLTLLPPRTASADVTMHVTNADGSVAEMCGNGLRCVVRHMLNGRPENARIGVDTGTGFLEGWADGGDIGVTMGRARLLAREISFETSALTGMAVAISMGNPHLVLPLLKPGTDLGAVAHEAGPALERHPHFPDRVNVGFVSRTGHGALDLVVFERGSGITRACGTGAAAAVVACRLRGEVILDGPVRVRLPGGVLRVRVAGSPQGDDLGGVEISGPARKVFDGRFS